MEGWWLGLLGAAGRASPAARCVESGARRVAVQGEIWAIGETARCSHEPVVEWGGPCCLIPTSALTVLDRGPAVSPTDSGRMQGGLAQKQVCAASE